MIRPLLRILLIIPVLYIVVIPGYISYKTGMKLCAGVVVSIKDSADYRFVSKREIQNLVNAKNTKLAGKPVKEIPVIEIEERLDVLKDLKYAEVYTTIDGKLHVDADQRDPVMRVMPRGGGDYYVDEEGLVFRKRSIYSPRLQIVVGNVNITSAMLNGMSVLDTASTSVLKDIYELVGFINSDSFWSAQVDQISVDGDREIDIIPRVGNQIVHLGPVEGYQQKFQNLEAFYKEVLPEVGWRKYETINLEFKDQIVCKRR